MIMATQERIYNPQEAEAFLKSKGIRRSDAQIRRDVTDGTIRGEKFKKSAPGRKAAYWYAIPESALLEFVKRWEEENG